MFKIAKLRKIQSKDTENPLRWIIDDNKAMIQTYENRSRRLEYNTVDISERQVNAIVKDYAVSKGLSIYEASVELKLQKRERYNTLKSLEVQND